MKLFTKSKEIETKSDLNVLSRKMLAEYDWIQRSWVICMIKLTKNFSRRNWFTLLTIFVLSIGIYSIYLAVDAFTVKQDHSFVIIPIRKLKHATETGEVSNQFLGISEEEYNRINRFYLYMDSLARSASGRKSYDSIISVRPGLMDSLSVIEDYYKKLKRK